MRYSDLLEYTKNDIDLRNAFKAAYDLNPIPGLNLEFTSAQREKETDQKPIVRDNSYIGGYSVFVWPSHIEVGSKSHPDDMRLWVQKAIRELNSNGISAKLNSDGDLITINPSSRNQPQEERVQILHRAIELLKPFLEENPTVKGNQNPNIDRRAPDIEIKYLLPWLRQNIKALGLDPIKDKVKIGKIRQELPLKAARANVKPFELDKFFKDNIKEFL